MIPALLLAAAGRFLLAPPGPQAQAATPEAARDAGWSFTVEPFLWLAGIEGRGRTGSDPPTDIGQDLSLFGELDGALMLAGEATPGGAGPSWFGDVLALSLEDDEGTLRTSTDALLIELGAGLPVTAGRSWEVLAGLRYVDLEYGVELGGLPDARADADWIDPWVGARGRVALSERWELRLRADLGGFGVGSDFTWQALAGLRRRLSPALSLDLGYRRIDLDFEDDDLTYDVRVSGPLIALAIQP